jgi:hypothetical protein
MILLFASFWHMWAAGIECDHKDCKDERGIAVSCAVISLALTLIAAGLRLLGNVETAIKAEGGAGALCFLLWVFGVFVITFKGPFESACSGSSDTNDDGSTHLYFTANGFFTAWICFIASSLALLEIPAVEKIVSRGVPGSSSGKLRAAMLLASFVILAQSSYTIDDVKYEDGLGLAICFSIFSILLVVLLMFTSILDSFKQYVLLGLCFMWFLGVSILTFQYHLTKKNVGNFKDTGNGYLSTWACFLISATLSFYEMFGGGEETDAAPDVNASSSSSDLAPASGIGAAPAEAPEDVKVEVEEGAE